MRKHSFSLLPKPALLAFAISAGAVAVAAAQKSTGNGWSGATAISPVLQPDPTRASQLTDVAVNANGLALAAWDQFSYTGSGGAAIGAAVQSAGKWGTPFTISGTSGFCMTPKVAVGSEGTMAVSWTYQDPTTVPAPQQKIQVAVKAPGTAAWTISTLAQGPLGGVALTQFVPVAIDASGNVTVCWDLWNGTLHAVQAATRPAGGTWSTPVTLAPGVDGLYVNLAVNARGDAGVVYSFSPYAGYSSGTAAQYVFRSGPNGTWNSPVTVSETIPSSVGYVTSPLVCLGASGLAVVTYLGYGIESTRQIAITSWTTPRVVLAAPNAISSFTSYDLSADQNGNAMVVASIFDATINVDRASIWVAVGTPTGAWTAPQRLTDPSIPVDAYATRAAVSADGGLALVGWIDHYHGTVQVSKLSNGVWGAANTIGRGTAWASFQEVLGLDAGSGTVARALWKNSKTGIQIMATGNGP